MVLTGFLFSGPVSRYDALTASGAVRDDAYQRSIVQALQDLYDDILKYQLKVTASRRDGSMFATVIKASQ